MNGKQRRRRHHQQHVLLLNYSAGASLFLSRLKVRFLGALIWLREFTQNTHLVEALLP